MIRMAALAGLILLTACDPQPSGGDDAGNAIAPQPSVTPAPSPAATAAGPLLNLAPDGLQLVDAATGSTRPLAFGMARDDAVAAVQRALGPGQGGDPCPLAPLERVRFKGVDLSFNDGKLAGWTANRDGGDAALTSMAGVGIGSTLADLEKAYAIEVAETSLGIEFTAGAMAGLLSSDAPTATITNLWAGETCIAR